MRKRVDWSALQSAKGYWYLASPYSKYPQGIEKAFEDVCIIAGELLKKNVRVYSPIAHTHPIADHTGMDPLDHTIWMWADEPMCDGAHGIIVAMMESWRDSYGVTEEIKAFEAAGKPIVYLPLDELGL